jgi:hypothetical protein
MGATETGVATTTTGTSDAGSWVGSTSEAAAISSFNMGTSTISGCTVTGIPKQVLVSTGPQMLVLGLVPVQAQQPNI